MAGRPLAWGLVLFSRLHLRLCTPNSSEPSLRCTERREPQATEGRKGRFWWREVRGDHRWGSWQPRSSEPRKDEKKGGRGQREGAKKTASLVGSVRSAALAKGPTALEPVPSPLRAGSPCPLPHTTTHTAKALPNWPQSPSTVPAATAPDRDTGQWTGLETLCVAATPEERALALLLHEEATPGVSADSWK